MFIVLPIGAGKPVAAAEAEDTPRTGKADEACGVAVLARLSLFASLQRLLMGKGMP